MSRRVSNSNKRLRSDEDLVQGRDRDKDKIRDMQVHIINMNEHINIIIKDMKNMKEKIEELEYKVTFRYIDMRNENVKRVSRVLLVSWFGLAITFAVKFWPNNVKFVF
tara:strand:- start:156 stop:479 length:324 start_codon:yes stop_codon:yes gene_type:complete